jgi:hypothetical protein
VDLAAAAAEAAGGPGQDGVPAVGQGLRVVADRVLGAAEAVPQQDRRRLVVAGRQVEPGVQVDRLGAGATGAGSSESSPHPATLSTVSTATANVA